MTSIEMQDMVLQSFQEKLQDTVDIRKVISMRFRFWFQGLMVPPPMATPPEQAAAPQGAPASEGAPA